MCRWFADQLVVVVVEPETSISAAVLATDVVYVEVVTKAPAVCPCEISAPVVPETKVEEQDQLNWSLTLRRRAHNG